MRKTEQRNCAVIYIVGGKANNLHILMVETPTTLPNLPVYQNKTKSINISIDTKV